MKRAHLWSIALISLSLLSMELIWTRIFSAEFFYTFAFLVLSLAVLGLGLGALSVRLFKRLNSERKLPLYLVLAGTFLLAGPPLVFGLKIDFAVLYHNGWMIAKLLLVLGLLSSPFYFGGMALAVLFRQNPDEMPRLYRADLLGAGSGVLIAVLMMNILGTPQAAFWSALPMLLAAILTGRSGWKFAAVLYLVPLFLLSTQAPKLLKTNRPERLPVIYEHWDAMAKIKIGTYGEEDLWRNINIDNVANTPVAKFDGNWDRPDSMQFGYDIDVQNLIRRFNKCTFLSLGAGGGRDVMQALQYGADEVHAVEVIPHINRLMQHGMLADYTGNIYNDPRVVVATEDARSYVRRFQNKFDIIYSLSSNTWAALASGSFALAENYLFTTEAFVDYWQALSENGFLVMEHQFYMPRVVSEVKDALSAMNIADPQNHFAVFRMPNKRRDILLLSKQELSTEILATAFGEQQNPQARDYKYLQYPAADSLKNNLIQRIVDNGWQAEADSAWIDIAPTTDDQPFVAQMGLWRNFDVQALNRLSIISEILGFPVSKLNILIIIAVVLLVVVPLNLLPLLCKGPKLRPAPWLYFFLIGMGFMFVEIVLIQKYTLLIGSSVYSLVVILLTLLTSSAVGSRYAGVVSTRFVFPALVLWLLAEAFVFGQLIYLARGMHLIWRITLTMLLVAPAGFLMGIPFPRAALEVGELVDWGFAVNGAASVLGSALVVLVAFSFGFSIALSAAALFYALAGLLSGRILA